MLLSLLISLISISSSSYMNQASPMVMKLDIEGDVSHSYSESDIKQSLPIISGWGGMQTNFGKIVDPIFWKGVHLPLLLNSIIGEVDYNLTIISSDGYKVNLTRQEVRGSIRTFNEENVTLNITAIPVLAFEENNTAIDSEFGPLRLVFIGENNQRILTRSFLWGRQIDTIHIDIEDGSTWQSSAEITSLNVVWLIIPTLIFLIIYRRKK